MTVLSTAQETSCDVLVIGGGMAGAWAAIAAREAGAHVILVDKGYCGSSGVTATAGPGHWWVAPGQREAAVDARYQQTLGLADKHWMHRIIEVTWTWMPTLAPWYDFSVDEQGSIQYGAVRGPEYMRALRQRLDDSGITVLDHSPALELLLHADGAVAGARGWQTRQQRDWFIRAGATILATGGCAFKSHLLGSGNNTGDGLLMAMEVGASLSGMEFSNAYCIAQDRTTMTRSMIYAFARYYDSFGRELDITPGEGAVFTVRLARALQNGPVFCGLQHVPDDVQRLLPEVSPNVSLLFSRAGVTEPFSRRFPVTLRAEGSIRGTGGICVGSSDGQTDIHGLYAVGDVATRVHVAGANTGGGAVNAAWALASGVLAGQSASSWTRQHGRRLELTVEAVGAAGLRPREHATDGDAAHEYVSLAREEMLPFDKNLFRHESRLTASLTNMNKAWGEIRAHLGGTPENRVKSREAAALIAAGRWTYEAALQREESRGLHTREDFPVLSGSAVYRSISRGLDQVTMDQEWMQ